MTDSLITRIGKINSNAANLDFWTLVESQPTLRTDALRHKNAAVSE